MDFDENLIKLYILNLLLKFIISFIFSTRPVQIDTFYKGKLALIYQ